MQLTHAALALALVVVGASAADTRHHRQQLDSRAALEKSAPFYPSPWMNPEADGWKEAYAEAKKFVSQMTLLEKVNLTTGIG
jgi:beta-glucosidase